MRLIIKPEKKYRPYYNRIYNISIVCQPYTFFVSLYQKDRKYIYRLWCGSNVVMSFNSKRELMLYIVNKMLHNSVI